MHYIDAWDDPPTSCNVDYERDCPEEGCSISAIANYTQRAGDTKLDKANTAEALRFLVHFIGDLTQPLHDEAYELGGNGINTTFEGYNDNLHSDWDTYFPNKIVGGSSLEDAQSWATSLVEEIESGSYKSEAPTWIEGDTINDVITTTLRWATDANAYICTVVMPDGPDALQTGDLYPTYYESTIDTIEVQIAKGGYRLGNWINMIYSKVAKCPPGKPFKGHHGPVPHPKDRDGRPPTRQLSRTNMARAAMGGSCCTSEGREHRK